MQIFCNVVLFANCALSIIYYICAFVWLYRVTAKTKPYGEDEASIFKSWEQYETKRNDAFTLNQVKILLVGLIFVVISAAACVGDGLSVENYIGIPILIPVACMLVFGFVFSCIFCDIGIKNKLVVFHHYMDKTLGHKYYNKYVTGFYGARGGSTMMMGAFIAAIASIPLAQTVYTIVILCV